MYRASAHQHNRSVYADTINGASNVQDHAGRAALLSFCLVLPASPASAWVQGSMSGRPGTFYVPRITGSHYTSRRAIQTAPPLQPSSSGILPATYPTTGGSSMVSAVVV
jgi:hypothetical protein